jgi:hypothetical protein
MASSPAGPNPWRGERSEQGGQRGKEWRRGEQAVWQGGVARRGGGAASRRRGKEEAWRADNAARRRRRDVVSEIF